MDDKENSLATIDSSYRSNLLALVSHELNTPLSGIVNAISVLENEKFKNPEFFEMLKRNTQRLRVTVDSLLELANADAGVLRVHLSEASLENVVQAQEEILRPFLKSNGFALQTIIEDQLPNVCIDSVRLGRVFNALVEHAVLFCDSSSRTKNKELLVNVHISLAPIDAVDQWLPNTSVRDQTGTFLTLEISTNVPTLAEVENFEDLFEPFSPWRDVYTRERDGIGVELALAREIMLGHRGFIGVGPAESAEGGWVFRFGVPILSREDELEAVIDNRIHGGASRLMKTSIVLIRPTEKSLAAVGDLRRVEEAVASLLYRSSDSVFSIASQGELTIVMDDCDANGSRKLADRITLELKEALPSLEFVWGVATGPDNGSTAEELLRHVRRHWHQFR